MSSIPLAQASLGAPNPNIVHLSVDTLSKMPIFQSGATYGQNRGNA